MIFCKMISKCVTGKKIYTTEVLAEDALIEAHIRFQYASNQGPIAVYRCEDCGYYHFTSQGLMNTRLKKHLNDGTIARQREAAHWQHKFDKRK